MIEFIERTRRCWQDLYGPWDFVFIGVIAAITAFVPDGAAIFYSNFALVTVTGTVMIAVIGAVVAAAAIVVSLIPKDELRKISRSGHGLADELWAFEFVVVAGVATLAVTLVGDALIDPSAVIASFDPDVTEPSLAPQRAYIFVSSALFMAAMFGTARLVRVIREIAELRLSLDDEDGEESPGVD